MERVVYQNIWFIVDYSIDDCFLNVKAFKIKSYDDNFEYETKLALTGELKFDGCFNFKYEETHYCGIYR